MEITIPEKTVFYIETMGSRYQSFRQKQVMYIHVYASVNCAIIGSSPSHYPKMPSVKWRAFYHSRDELVINRISVYHQWVNSSPPSAAYMRQWIGSALVQIMAWRLIGIKPLSKPMLGYCQLDPSVQRGARWLCSPCLGICHSIMYMHFATQYQKCTGKPRTFFNSLRPIDTYMWH